MTPAQRHKERVASMPCMLCLAMGLPAEKPSNLHHIRESQGMSQRSSDYLVIPVCKDCHQGPKGIHGDKTYLRIAKVSELDLLAWTIERLSKC